MAELLELLTPRLQHQADQLLTGLQGQQQWNPRLPVALLNRCWLQLQVVAVADLARNLPPDPSGDAPELVRFRELRRQGLDHLAAQEQCWLEFGREPCSEALQRFWRAQERGNHGWTLSRYLDLLNRYRHQLEHDGPTPLPLLVLARSGSGEAHGVVWLWPSSPAMRHTCA